MTDLTPNATLDAPVLRRTKKQKRRTFQTGIAALNKQAAGKPITKKGLGVFDAMAVAFIQNVSSTAGMLSERNGSSTINTKVTEAAIMMNYPADIAVEMIHAGRSAIAAYKSNSTK